MTQYSIDPVEVVKFIKKLKQSELGENIFICTKYGSYRLKYTGYLSEFKNRTIKLELLGEVDNERDKSTR